MADSMGNATSGALARSRAQSPADARPGLAASIPALVCIFCALLSTSPAATVKRSLPPRFDPTSAWLQYLPLRTPAVRALDRETPRQLILLDSSPQVRSAARELRRGFASMVGLRLHPAKPASSPVIQLPHGGAVLLGTAQELRRALPFLRFPALRPGGFVVRSLRRQGQPLLLIAGADANGVLYGSFALLRHMALAEPVPDIRLQESPAVPVRWVNEWDNLNGRIERGYGGNSIFFDQGQVRADLTRVSQYGRLLASLGINGCVVNNVNADPRSLAASFLPQLARIANALRPWGVRLALSANLSSPQSEGKLATYDPLDPNVAQWWRMKADQIYRLIPDFAGFLVKAGAEGQPGPDVYHRTHADAANVVARAVAPHGGLVLYRAFVYNNHLDYHDLKADRARAAYDIIHPLDGKFDANVIVQIKNGPIDFQVREPISPLLLDLPHTRKAVELEITQEYLGQQRQVVYLVPMWRQALRWLQHPPAGFAGVAGVGLDPNWLGSDMAQANLYGYGRLAWDRKLTARRILREWTQLSFGPDPLVNHTVNAIQMRSWPTYEHYTGVLGLQTLTNIVGPHYGPGPASADHNGWGQWIRAGHHGIGMDRTSASGTGFLGQYPSWLEARYTSLATCPDHLLLFMHHLPYTYRLHNGESVIQDIYDAHYRGASEAAQFPQWWMALRGHLDPQVYQATLNELRYQAGYAVVWRDFINQYFFELSGIPDQRGRVGHHPDRVEAEAMRLRGYRVVAVTPAEAASQGKAVACPAHQAVCSAGTIVRQPNGTYTLSVLYYAPAQGTARFELLAGGRPIAHWTSMKGLPGSTLNADTAVRLSFPHIRLRKGEPLTVRAVPSGGNPAGLDYIALHREAAGSR